MPLFETKALQKSIVRTKTKPLSITIQTLYWISLEAHKSVNDVE